MDYFDKIYKEASGVDIREQKRIWDERGRGYYGEYRVMQELYQNLPGQCKILMNLNVPIGDGKITEIDLLLIHETGIFVFEIKHYKGTIYGSNNGKVWTQYFRTSKNHTFNNPVLQNDYHIKALQYYLPNAPFHSVIVFTHGECDLRITNNDPSLQICSLHSLLSSLSTKMNELPIQYSPHDIENIFSSLLPFSPMKEEVSIAEKPPLPLHEFIEVMNRDLVAERQELQDNYNNKAKQLELRKKKIYLNSIVISIICGILSILFCLYQAQECDEKISTAQLEVEKMAQNFKHVNELNDGNIEFIAGMILLDNLVLSQSPDIVDAVDFSCDLVANSNDYGIRLTENTKYIVMTKDGKIAEYDMFDSLNKYSSLYKVGKSTFPIFNIKKQFYNIDVQDISYIKLTKISLWRKNINSNKDLITDLELELYSTQ
ncbi:MAG: NERD domain-containing protein [Ruminococcaceae bacterium]|nr:NERD domain-containing protein [Oscillospiraceae bacterium]